MSKLLKAAFFVVALGAMVGLLPTPSAQALCNDPEKTMVHWDPEWTDVSLSLSPAVVSGNTVSVTARGVHAGRVFYCSEYGNYYNVVLSLEVKKNLSGATAIYTTSQTIAAPTGDPLYYDDGFYQHTFTIPITNLDAGGYTIYVTATSGPSNHVTTANGSVSFEKAGTPPDIGTPAIDFSANYYVVGDGAGTFHNPLGNNQTGGDPLILFWSSPDATSCTATDGEGFEVNATSGSDIPSALTNTTDFWIQCTDGVSTNSAMLKIKKIAEPQNVNISINRSALNRNAGPLTITWSSQYAEECTGTVDRGDSSMDLVLRGTSGSITTNPDHSNLHYSGGNSPASAPITATITCSNYANPDRPSDSATSQIFYNFVRWKGYVKNQCSSPENSAVRMNSTSENQARFTVDLFDVSNNLSTHVYEGSRLNDGDDRSWGQRPVFEYRVTDMTTVPTGYSYCSNTGPATFQANDIYSPQDKEVKFFFTSSGGPTPSPVPTLTLGATQCDSAPNLNKASVALSWTASTNNLDHYEIWSGNSMLASVGTVTTYTLRNLTPNTSYTLNVNAFNGSNQSVSSNSVTVTTAGPCPSSSPTPSPTPPASPTNFQAIGECHTNYPSSIGQVYMSWSASAGATSYKIYRERFGPDEKIAENITQTSYIYRPVDLGSSENYYVIAVNAAGNSARSNTDDGNVPSSCAGDPPGDCPSIDTYVIDPSQGNVMVNATYAFRGLYDPDGGNGSRYGNFDVSSIASWISRQTNIAVSQGGGVFRGVAAGTARVESTYCELTPWAQLGVTGNGPDFNIIVTPDLQNTGKPGTLTYRVDVNPLNGFTGIVNLTQQDLPSGTSGTLNPTSINTTGVSTLTVSVTGSAAIGRSTFRVTGTSGALSHFDTADINITDAPPPPSNGSVDLKINGQDDLTGSNAIIYPPGSPFDVADLNITWSSHDVSSCVASRVPVGGQSIDWGQHAISVSGNESEVISEGSYTFNIACDTDSTDMVPVQFIACSWGDPAPCPQITECDLSANPGSIQIGEEATLSWRCPLDRENCSIDQGVGAINIPTGSAVVEPRRDTTYSLSCGGRFEDSTEIEVGRSFLDRLREVIPR